MVKMNLKKKQFVLSLIVLIITTILVFSRTYIVSFIKGENINSGIKFSRVFDYKSTKDKSISVSSVYGKDEYFYFNDSGNLNAYLKEGKFLWSKKFSKETIMHKNGNRIVVADRAKGNIYLLDLDGKQIANIVGTGKITSVKLLDNGSIITTSSDGNKINIYRNNFKEHIPISIGTGFIVKYEVLEIMDRIVILVIEDSNQEVISGIYEYSLNGNFLKSTTIDRLLLQIYFWQEGFVLVYPDSVVITKDDINQTLDTKYFDNIIGANKYGSLLYLRIKKEATNENLERINLARFDLLKKSLDFTTKINQNYVNIYTKDRYILGYNSLGIDIIDMSGNLLSNRKLEFQIDKLYLLNEDHVLVTNGEYISILKIEE